MEEAPPVGQIFVVSYTWSATKHPSPAGAKVRELVAILDRLGASDDGGVFFDFASLPQGDMTERDKHDKHKIVSTVPGIYLDSNPYSRKAPRSKEHLDGRNEDERARFNFALFETTRLYAYGGSKVIVLPDKDEVATFPDAGEIAEQVNDFCDPPRPEMHSNWGFTKKMGYEHSGWCCAEFAIALRNGTIANVRSVVKKTKQKSCSLPIMASLASIALLAFWTVRDACAPPVLTAFQPSLLPSKYLLIFSGTT